MPQTQTKTQTVTNTQLATAVVAAFLAGGLAFAAAPAKQLVPAAAANQCKVSLVQFSAPCGKDMYKMRSYTCSDGFSPALVQKCMSTAEIQKEAEAFCSQRKCVAPLALNHVASNTATSTPPAPVTSTPFINLHITNDDIHLSAGDVPGSADITARVTNTGNIAVPSLGNQAQDAQIFADSELDANQNFIMGTLDYQSLVGLQPGESRIMHFPRFINPTTHFIRVKLDSFEAIPESDETDNIATVPVAPEFLGPGDLTFANNNVTFVRSQNGAVRITTNIINNNINAFPAATILRHEFLNAQGNRVLNDSQSLLGVAFSRNINRSLPYDVETNLDAYTQRGAVSDRITLDSSNIIFESDEANNQITVPIPQEFLPQNDPQVY